LNGRYLINWKCENGLFKVTRTLQKGILDEYRFLKKEERVSDELWSRRPAESCWTSSGVLCSFVGEGATYYTQPWRILVSKDDRCPSPKSNNCSDRRSTFTTSSLNRAPRLISAEHPDSSARAATVCSRPHGLFVIFSITAYTDTYSHFSLALPIVSLELTGELLIAVQA